MFTRMKYAHPNPDILTGFGLIVPEDDPRVHIDIYRECPLCGRIVRMASAWDWSRTDLGDICARCYTARYHELAEQGVPLAHA